MVALPILLAALLAQETQPAAWTSHRKLADAISTVFVVTNLTGSVVEAWRQPHRGHALGCVALRNGLVIGSVQTVKALVHRTRPDGSDQKSFYSSHTALAVVNTGWRYQISIPIAIGAGYGRAAAAKHYTSDILVGAGVGALSMRVCREETR